MIDRFHQGVEQLLREAADAWERRAWDKTYNLAAEALIFEPDNLDAKKLLAAATRNIGAGTMTADRRHISVMFVDLVGSTPLANTMELEDFTALNLLFERACEPIIESNGGRLTEFYGDGLVAYFGYPRSHENNTCRAVVAGLEIQEQLALINSSPSREHRLEARVAVHTGEVVLSDRGSAAWTQRSAAFGAPMSTASRLQSEAAAGSVVVERQTLELVAEDFAFTSLGTRRLKGMEDQEIEVFRVDRRLDPPSPSSHAIDGARPFVGRRQELDHLVGCWRALASGHPTVPAESMVLVTGEAGIGKSRLVQELVAVSLEDGNQPLELQCSSYGNRSSLFPVRLALERYAEIDADDGPQERSAKLEELVTSAGLDPEDIVPLLSQLLGVPPTPRFPPPKLAPGQLSEAIFGALVELVVSLSSAAPFVTLIEDLHWADQATLELLSRIVATKPATLILATARARSENGFGDIDPVHIHLSPLDEQDSRSLAVHLLDDGAPDALAAEITERSDGVPLYVEQLVRIVSDGRQDPARIPRRLEELLQARLDVVGTAKQIAQLASVIGREFRLDTLHRALISVGTLAADDDMDVDMRILSDASLIEDSSAGVQHRRFRHALLAEKAHDSLLEPDRKRFHRAVAEAMLTRAGDVADEDPTVIALHFEEAGCASEAVVQLLRSADAAMGRGALPDAASSLDRAMTLLDDVADESRKMLELKLRLSRGFIASSSQGYAAPAVIADYRRALDLCEELSGLPDVAVDSVKALFGLWTFYAGSGDLVGCARSEELLATALSGTTYAGGWPALDASRGVRHFYLGEFEEARTVLEAAVKQLEADPIDSASWHLPNDPLVAGGAFLMLLRFMMGDESGADELARELRRRTESLPFPQGPFSSSFLRNFEIRLARSRGDVETAIKLSEALLEEATTFGFSDWSLVAMMNLPRCRSLTNPTLDGCREIHGAVDLFVALGAVVLVNEVMAALAELYVEVGEPESGRELVTSAMDLVDQGQRAALVEVHLASARVDHATGATTAEVGRSVVAALETAKAQRSPYHVACCAAAAAELTPGADVSAFQETIADALAVFSPQTRIPAVVAARRAYG